tara:strand:- start:16551 stop:17588 length:1038 start_codon:yes stop_codon:yes gene_type:complete
MMKSLQLVAPRTVELRELEDPPTPGSDEVLVKLRAVGLCGSDMHWYSEGGCAGSDANYPMVLGHEPAGEIVEVGHGVEKLSSGMRVAVEPTISCGVCEKCVSGHFNLCDESIFMGGFQMPGLLRQYAVVPTRNVSVVPETMSFTDAVVVEPLAVLLHTLELAKLTPDDAVAIMGAGPIGLLAAAVTKQAGASCVTIADRIPERLELAKKFGADAVVDFTKDSVSDAVYDMTNGKGAHIVIDAAGNAESVSDAIASARSGATVVVVGIPSQREVEVPLWQAMDKELKFHIQKRSNNNDHEAISMINRQLIDISPLVTHRFPFEQGDRAFQMVHDYSDGVCKAVIEL